MKVFISSVVTGMEAHRDSAAKAARILKHEVLRSEDFGAASATPQRVCLAGVRAADVVLLLLGKRYGALQASGLSATHEEFREAKERCSVLVFVEKDGRRDDAQEKFLREVQAWASGLYTATFASPEELHEAVLSALHQLELARHMGPIDAAEMLARAKEALPRHGARFGEATLSLVIVGAPRQQLLRPAELERSTLARELTQEVLFGPVTLFRTESGTDSRLAGDRLELSQDDRAVVLDQEGTVLIQLPAQEDAKGHSYLPVLVEEFVTEQLYAALRFADWILEKVDPTHRLQEVGPLAAVSGAGHLGWKTREDHRRNPNTVSLGIGAGDEIIAHLHPVNRRREMLHIDAKRLAEDLTVLLRRQKRG